MTIAAGDGWIELNWNPPVDDGGSEIIEYVLLKGSSETALNDSLYMDDSLTFREMNLNNGQTYYYSVYARNCVGDGERSFVRSATPWALPNPPFSLEAEVSAENVILLWEAPVSAGNAPVYGFIVLRGTSKYDLTPIADLGLVLTYTDSDVVDDRTYYYQLVAKSDATMQHPFTFVAA